MQVDAASLKSKESKIVHGRIACFLSVIFLFIAAVVEVALYFGLINGGSPQKDPSTYALDPTYLSQIWAWRRGTFPALLAVAFLNSAVNQYPFQI